MNGQFLFGDNFSAFRINKSWFFFMVAVSLIKLMTFAALNSGRTSLDAEVNLPSVVQSDSNSLSKSSQTINLNITKAPNALNTSEIKNLVDKQAKQFNKTKNKLPETPVTTTTTFDPLTKNGITIHVSHQITASAKTVKIKKYADADHLPPLEYGMQNVTLGNNGYTIDGLNKRYTKIAIETDVSKIPQGYTLNDVFSFWYDAENKHWVQLRRETLDLSSGTVYSSTNKDGEYINGIIQTPDAPETQGYMPTTMSDIKAADPASMVQIIQPPVANNQGSANLSYHIETPKGRQGIEPNLSIIYNSNGSNSWLGQGWDLAGISSITIDTRWGRPEYDNAKETETYLFKGQMLALLDGNEATEPHRNFDANGDSKIIRRADTVQFYPRKEKNFEHLVRYGSDPGNCYWILTDKNGVQYFYGQSAESRLGAPVQNADGKINSGIAEWKIDSIADVYGNSMTYHYSSDDYPINGKSETSHNIYLKSIAYTNHRLLPNGPNYDIVFFSDTSRDDNLSNARYGFFTGNRRWLDSIQIKYKRAGINPQGAEVFRTYTFTNFKGAFNKTLLKRISQGDGRKEFNHHDFTYYNDIADGSLFADSHTFTVASDKLITGMPGFSTISLPDKPSAISTTKAYANSGSFYVGIGPSDQNYAQKSNTAGIRGGFSSSNSNGLNTLIDIDGDGLPDKVFVQDQKKLAFRKNLGTQFSDTTTQIDIPISDFYEENSKTYNVGAESNFFIFGGVDYSSTNATISTYFADVNADGLPDIISNGVVYFNHLENKRPVFSTSSKNSFVQMNGGSVAALVPDINAEKIRIQNKKDTLVKYNPLNDVIRIWEAPFDDSIRVSAPVKQTFVDVARLSVAEQREFDKADGIRASIQVGDGSSYYDSISLEKNDTITHTLPKVTTGYFKIKKGTRVYFRLQSTKTSGNKYANGSFDQISWKPEIISWHYDSTAKQNDVFNKNKYRYRITEDYLVTQKQIAYTTPAKGNLLLTGSINKESTNDSIIIQAFLLKKNNSGTVKIKNPLDSMLAKICDSAVTGSFKIKYPDSTNSFFACPCYKLSDSCKFVKLDSIAIRKDTAIPVFTIPMPPKSFSKNISQNINVDSADMLILNIISPENTGLSAISWKPKIFAKNDAGTIIDSTYLIPNYKFNDTLVSSGSYSPLLTGTKYLVTPYIKFKDTLNAGGNLIYAIRNNDSVLYKLNVKYSNGILQSADTFKTPIKFPNTPDSLYITYENPAEQLDTINDNLYFKIDTAYYVVNKYDSLLGSVYDARGTIFKAKQPGKYFIEHQLAFKKSIYPDKIKCTIIHAYAAPAKKDTLTDTLYFDNISKKYRKTDTLFINKDDIVTVDYSYFGLFSLPDSIVSSRTDYIHAVIPAQVWNQRKDIKFGPMYRGWGQFVYGGGFGNYSDYIIEDSLVLSTTNPDKDFASTVATDVTQLIAKQDASDMPVVPSMDAFNPLKKAFGVLKAYVNKKGDYYWQGSDSSVYLKMDIANSSRFGIKDISVQSPFLNSNNQPRKATGNFDAIGVEKTSNSKSWSFNLGYSFNSGAKSLSASYAEGNSTVESDYIDINGDRYPDIISNGNILTTLPNGKFNSSPWSQNFNHHSENNVYGGGGGASFPQASPIFGTGNTKKTASSANMSQTGSNDASKDGKNAKDNIGVNGSCSYSTDDVQSTWMDINGDGLSDKIEKKNDIVTVYLNMGGQHFSSGIQYNDLNTILESESLSLSPNTSLGVNIGDRSIVAGAGISLSRSLPKLSLQDINNDGLPDLVQIDNQKINLHINNGMNFISEHATGSLSNTASLHGFPTPDVSVLKSSFNASLGTSFGGSFTIGIPIPICLGFPCVKIAVADIGFSHSNNVAQTKKQLIDIDGDGFPDLLESDAEDNLMVSLSKIARTNKLDTVLNPLGGKFIIDYTHNKSTQDDPYGKWVMSKLTINDGIEDDGPNPVDSFSYTGGKQEQYEREFLGFNTVVTDNMNGTTVYRRHVLQYDTANYYAAGNLTAEWVEDIAGNKYSETQNTYFVDLINPVDGNRGNYEHLTVGAPEKFFNGICFSAISYSKKGMHEHNNSKFVGNYSTFKYDLLGNLTDFYYNDKDTVAYKYHTDIRYNPFDIKKKIFGLRVMAVVKTKTGAVVRKTSAVYNDSGKITSLTRLNSQVGEHSDTTFFSYDTLGNITARKLPKNANNQSVVYNYHYDEATNIYIDSVRQEAGAEFNFFSFTRTNPKFGIADYAKDIHDKEVSYIIDDFGRIEKIIGPKQSTAGYTVKFRYPDSLKNSAGLYAVTTHYDGNNPGIKTINFIDGFKRSVQVKKTGVVDADLAGKWIVSGKNYYDSLGRIVKAYQPTTCNEPDSTKLLFAWSRDSNPIETKYEILDRPTEVKMQDGSLYSKTTYTIAGNNTVETEELQNPSGNQVKQLFTDGSSLKVRESYNGVNTYYTYDDILQPAQITDYANRPIFKYEYDHAGRRTKSVSLNGGINSVEYNDAGNIIKRTNSKAEITEYQYDYNRLVKIHYAADTVNDVRYVYGKSSSAGQDANQARNRIIYQEDASGAQSFTYDELGNIAKNSRTIISPFDSSNYTFTTSYDYDTWNRIQKITYPDNDWLEYKYNNAGLLDNVLQHRFRNDNNTDTLIAHIGYDQFEQRVLMQYGTNNKISTRYTYESKRRRLDSLNTTRYKSSLTRSGYQYDNLNNILGIQTDNSPANNLAPNTNLNYDYRYDNFNRLTFAGNVWDSANTQMGYFDTLTLSYNKDFSIRKKTNIYAGHPDNLSRKITDTLIYSDKHQLTQLRHRTIRTQKKYQYSDGTQGALKYDDSTIERYAYDNKGNDTLRLVSEQYGTNTAGNTNSRKILWDIENHIRAVDIDGLISAYIYDADGNRTIKISTQSMGSYVNGLKGADTTMAASFSLYANPYFSIRNGDGLYTKHIYIGGERICSQVENDGYYKNEPLGGASLPRGDNCAVCETDYNDSCKTADYNNKATTISVVLNDCFKAFDLPFPKLPTNALNNKPKTKAEIRRSNDTPIFGRYFYHINQIGSVNMVSTDEGKIVQYTAYLPFGETFVSKTAGYNSQFTFNGKEQDQETGLYYYGARYYDPHTYQWLGVDPMAEKYAGLCAYNFNLGNPIRMIDYVGKQTQEAETVLATNTETFNKKLEDTKGFAEGYDKILLAGDLAKELAKDVQSPAAKAFLVNMHEALDIGKFAAVPGILAGTIETGLDYEQVKKGEMTPGRAVFHLGVNTSTLAIGLIGGLSIEAGVLGLYAKAMEQGYDGVQSVLYQTYLHFENLQYNLINNQFPFR